MPGFFCCCDLRPKPQGFFDRLIIDADPVQGGCIHQGRHAALALRGLAHGEQQLLADGIDQQACAGLNQPGIQRFLSEDITCGIHQHKSLLASIGRPAAEHSPDAGSAVVAGHRQNGVLPQMQLTGGDTGTHQFDRAAVVRPVPDQNSPA